ncbi:MAG: protein kinase [Planctomycetes bacterium]|nr:protein kinase [Planctomycetota bacterium]MBI3847067.1 protein kinase [Planctomycetota bacterium]
MQIVCKQCQATMDVPDDEAALRGLCAACAAKARSLGPNPPRSLGKYEIRELIGRGSMGRVYRAFQPDLQRDVAIKILVAGEHASEETLRRFQREARLAAQLHHPGIVQIHDVGSEGSLHYIVMEHIAGRTLEKLLSTRRLGIDNALRIAHAVAKALQFAHEHGVIHRDIKPANIVIDGDGRVRILDFGLARGLDEEEATLAGTVMGTPHYMSPEQAFSATGEVDGRTDVYSLGAVLYEMLTGRRPFESATLLSVLRRIDEEEPAPPSRIDPTIPESVDALILRAMEKDPARRFASAEAMLAAIDDCLAERRAATPRDVPSPRPWIRSPRIRWIAALALGAVLALVAAWEVWPSDAGDAGDADDYAPMAAQLALIQSEIEQADRLEDFGARSRSLEGAYEKLASIAPEKADEWSTSLEADIHRRLGCYGLAALETSRVVEKDPSDMGARCRLVLDRLAAAPARMPFLGIGIFPHVDGDAVRAIEDSMIASGATQGDSSLVAAVARYVDGKPARALENLKAARASGGAPDDVLLVRGTFELMQVVRDSTSEESKTLLGALLRDMDALLRAQPRSAAVRWLRALARHVAGDATGAWADADLLLSQAPTSAETYLLRTILQEREGQYDVAQENFERVARLDPSVDADLGRIYLGVVGVFGKAGMAVPDLEALEYWRVRLDHRLARWNEPASLLLRAAITEIGSRWNTAAADLAAFHLLPDPPSLALSHRELTTLTTLAAAPTRTRLMCTSRDWQLRLGLSDLCRSTCDAILERLGDTALARLDGVGDDERVAIERDCHYDLALLAATAGDDRQMCAQLDEAVARGTKIEEVLRDSKFASVRERPAFREWLDRHSR